MTKTRMMTFAALGAALSTLLPAQTSAQPSANRFIPENSSIVLRIASPAKWRKQFGQTQVAKLGEAQSLAPFMGMIGQTVQMSLESMRETGAFDADLVDGLLNEWMGDIVFSVQIDWDGLLDAMDYGETPPFSMVVALTPDGSFDLGAVAKEFNALVDREAPDGAVTDLAVGDLTMRRADMGGDGPQMTIPMMVDGHLVMLGSPQLEKDAAKLVGSEGRMTLQDTSPFYVRAEIGKVISTLLEADTGGAPFDPAEMMDMIGFSALQDMTLSIRPDGKSVVGDMHIGLAAKNRGVFNMLAQGNQPPKLLGSVPPKSEAFAITAMDLSAIYTTIQDVWGLAEDFAPMTFDDAIGMINESTKIDLKKDLIDNLGNEMLTVQDPDAVLNADPDDMEDNPAAMLAGTVYGISLKDGKAFNAALDKLIRSRGMHVGRKSEAYANTEVHRMKLLGMIPLEYSIANNLLLIGVGGDKTGRIIRDIIDTRAAGDGGMPEALAAKAAGLKPGWNSIGITPVGSMIQGVMMGLEASGEFGEMEMVKQIVNGVLGDMKRLGINSMVQASYCDETGFTSSFRW